MGACALDAEQRAALAEAKLARSEESADRSGSLRAKVAAAGPRPRVSRESRPCTAACRRICAPGLLGLTVRILASSIRPVRGRARRAPFWPPSGSWWRWKATEVPRPRRCRRSRSGPVAPASRVWPPHSSARAGLRPAITADRHARPLCAARAGSSSFAQMWRRPAPLGVICVVRLSASPAGARPDYAAHFALVELRQPDARAPRTGIKSQR